MVGHNLPLLIETGVTYIACLTIDYAPDIIMYIYQSSKLCKP